MGGVVLPHAHHLRARDDGGEQSDVLERDDGAGGADLRVQGVAGDAVDHVTAVLGLHDAVHGVVTGGESSDAHTRQSRSSGSVRRSGLTAPAPPTGSTGDGARPPAGRRTPAPPAPVHGPSSPRARSAGAVYRGW